MADAPADCVATHQPRATQRTAFVILHRPKLHCSRVWICSRERRKQMLRQSGLYGDPTILRRKRLDPAGPLLEGSTKPPNKKADKGLYSLPLSRTIGFCFLFLNYYYFLNQLQICSHGSWGRKTSPPGAWSRLNVNGSQRRAVPGKLHECSQEISKRNSISSKCC